MEIEYVFSFDYDTHTQLINESKLLTKEECVKTHLESARTWVGTWHRMGFDTKTKLTASVFYSRNSDELGQQILWIGLKPDGMTRSSTYSTQSFITTPSAI